MIKNKLPMGQRVSFTAISESRYSQQAEEWNDENERKVAKIPYNGSGIICGVRVLQEGHMEEIVEDVPEHSEYNVWRCTKHVDVYLVAVSYACIVRVQPEDITETTP